MSKWTRTRRDPGRTYQDEYEARQLRADMRRVRELVLEAAEGNTEAEDAFLKVINTVEPAMTKERRKELIRQFRHAVSPERRQPGL